MNTRYAINRVRGIFDAKIEHDGRTVGEFFEAAKAAAIQSEERRLDALRALTFEQFSSNYLSRGVTESTRLVRNEVSREH